MRDATVNMKDGRVLCAPIWEWKPAGGWMTLVGHVLEPVRFVDVAEAHVMMWRQAGTGPEPVDLLELARVEGWDGR